MRFWFVHSGEVSLREQLCTQVYLGISSGALRPGQRLPSTREMARRYSLHPNTVSAAYQQLQGEGLAESRRGAGIYVRAAAAAPPDNGNRQLDRLIAGFLSSTRAQGFTLEQLVERARRWMDVQPPDHFLLVEPEPERQEIVLAELRSELRLTVRACATAECGDSTGCIALALPSKVDEVRAALPPHVELVTLRVTTVPDMKAWLSVADQLLVGVVSRWPEFVKIARTMLVASGFSTERLVERIRGEHGWRAGLEATAAVLCDAATAPLLPQKTRAEIFRLVSGETIAELRAMEESITARLNAAPEG